MTERPSQATLTTLPPGIDPQEFAKFGDCGLVIAFVAIAVARTTDPSGARRMALRFSAIATSKLRMSCETIPRLL